MPSIVPAFVNSGQRLNLDALRLLAQQANSAFNLADQPYTFLPPVMAIDDPADLVKNFRADNGDYPGTIVIVRSTRTAYQIFGPYTSLANWHIIPAVIADNPTTLQNTPGTIGLLGYVLSDDTVWIFRNDFGNQVWRSYTNSELPPFPDTPSPGGIRGEMYRLWVNLMHPPRPDQKAVIRVSNSDLVSYTPTNGISTAQFSFVGQALAVREVWGLKWNNPLPYVPWFDRYRDILFVYDPLISPAPDVRTELALAGPNDEFFVNDFSTIAIVQGQRIRVSNMPPGLTGTLTGSVFYFAGQVGFPPPVPQAGDIPSIAPWIVKIDIEQFLGVWQIIYHFQNNAYDGAEFNIAFAPTVVLSDRYLSQVGLEIRNPAASAIGVSGINRAGPLKGIPILGTISKYLQSAVSISFQVFAHLPGSTDWDDMGALLVELFPGSVGIFIATPAPLAYLNTAAGNLNPYTNGPTGRVPEASQFFPDPRDKTGLRLLQVKPAQNYKPGNWPVQRSTDPPKHDVVSGDIWANASNPVAQLQYSTIFQIFIGRAPDPADPNHLLKPIAQRAPLAVELGCWQNNIFVAFQTVTIPAGAVGASISVAWPIFTDDALVYRCAEAIVLQAMIAVWNQTVQSMFSYGTNQANVNQPSYPLAAFEYNDLLNLVDQLQLRPPP